MTLDSPAVPSKHHPLKPSVITKTTEIIRMRGQSSLRPQDVVQRKSNKRPSLLALKIQKIEHLFAE